jgi:hypothetical protein
MCEWTQRLPEGHRDDADAILLGAAARGADTPGAADTPGDAGQPGATATADGPAQPGGVGAGGAGAPAIYFLVPDPASGS